MLTHATEGKLSPRSATTSLHKYATTVRKHEDQHTESSGGTPKVPRVTRGLQIARSHVPARILATRRLPLRSHCVPHSSCGSTAIPLSVITLEHALQ